MSLRERLPSGALVLASISLVNLFLGFGREATIAYFFGTSPEIDTFLVSIAFPSILVVNISAISVAVVLPIYISYREAGDHASASSLVHKWFWFSGLLIGTLCALMFFTAEELMSLMAAGFDSEQRLQAVAWLRRLLPYVWLMSMLGIFKVVLNSHEHFGVPALSSPLVSICVIAACALGAREFGVEVLIAGLSTGALLAYVWQWLNSRRFEPQLPRLSGLRSEVPLPLAAGGAMVLHSLALQVDVVVDRSFASGLPEGSVAAYNYACILNAIPGALVSSVLATVLFPVLARRGAGGDWPGALRTVQRWSLGLFLAGLAPVLLLIAFREEIVSIVFQRGAFSERGVEMTAEVLRVLPAMMILGAVSGLFTQLLLAQQRARIVAIVAAVAIATKVALNFVFVERYGLLGLAMATVIASAAATLVRIIFARRYQAAWSP